MGPGGLLALPLGRQGTCPSRVVPGGRRWCGWGVGGWHVGGEAWLCSPAGMAWHGGWVHPCWPCPQLAPTPTPPSQLSTGLSLHCGDPCRPCCHPDPVDSSSTWDSSGHPHPPPPPTCSRWVPSQQARCLGGWGVFGRIWACSRLPLLILSRSAVGITPKLARGGELGGVEHGMASMVVCHCHLLHLGGGMSRHCWGSQGTVDRWKGEQYRIPSLGGGLGRLASPAPLVESM